MHYVHKKARCGPEIATFRTKTPRFLRVIRLNWLAKIDFRGTRSPWFFNIVVSYTVVSEKCKKETKTEETIGFFVTFLSLVKFQLGRGRTPCPTPLGHAYAPSEENQKVLANFLRSFWRFPTKLNCSKNSAVLEPRTGQFSRTLSFEAKAKDLTFEAKAKDFKMCPRGQERSRGLHLC